MTFVVVALALLLTLLDAAKPLVVDDGAFYQYAHHIAHHPADPYGFELFWYAVPQPANEVLAPPVLLYWWAAAIRLFGDHPVAWKLSLFPFALLLSASLARLLRDVAPGAQRSLLCMIVLSPAILPAFNLMLDVPALALSLASLVLLREACERERGGTLAFAAGLVGGLALQTKYTALLPLVASLGYALLARRGRHALVMGATAGGLFLAWEIHVARLYGESHFVLASGFAPRFSSATPAQWGFALLCLLGCSSPAIGLLALCAKPVRGRWVAGAVVALTAAFAGVALLPPLPIASVGAVDPAWSRLEPEALLFASIGAFVAGSVGWVLWQRIGQGREQGDEALAGRRAPSRLGRLDAFLLLWLAIELAGFFAASPYPALRRVIGLHVVLALVAGRALGASIGPFPAQRARTAVVAWGVALGFLFAISDLCDARARRDGFERALARLEAEDAESGRATRWYVGHWEFQYYAERSGLRAVIPGSSRLERGDWLVYPSGVHRQPMRVPARSVESVAVVEAASAWPWSTLPSAYSGYRPLRPQPDAQLEIALLRVVEGFTPDAW